MKGKKHRPEQIIKKLREADAMLSADKTIGQECSRRKFRIQRAPLTGTGFGGSVKNPTLAAPACCSSTMARASVP